MAQDGALQLPELRARLDAELRAERPVGRAIGLERLLLAARPVEREHQLCAEPLAIRVLGDELLELAHEALVTTERQLHVGAQFERVDAQLGERAGVRIRDRLAGQVGERRPGPKR